MATSTLTETTIRPALSTDLESLYSLIGSIYESTEIMCEEFLEKYPNLETLERDYIEIASSDGSVFLVAEDAFGPTGYVTVKPCPQSKLSHTAYLNMGVADRARGRSIGRKLLAAALNAVSTQRVIEILYLNVREDNVAAVRLYESLSFETIARLERDTKIGDQYFTGLLMRRFIV